MVIGFLVGGCYGLAQAQPVWEQTVGIPIGTNQNVSDLYVAGDGSTFLAITADNGYNNDGIVYKWNSGGLIQWFQRYGDPNNFTSTANERYVAITGDSGGNAYSSGDAFILGNQRDLLVSKYGPTGTPLWSKTFNSGTGVDDECAKGVVLDSSGNVYALATGHGSTSNNVVLVKYSSTGSRLWSRTFNTGSHSGQDWGGATRLCLDKPGTGLIILGSGATGDTKVLKYNLSGALQWSKSYPTRVGVNLTTDSGGNVYVCGWAANGSGIDDMDTWKISAGGLDTWNTVVTYAGSVEAHAQAVKIDVTGNVVIGGYSVPSGTGYSAEIAKISSAGTLTWKYSLAPAQYQLLGDLTTTSDGNIYATGYESIAGGLYRALAVAVDSAGSGLWDWYSTQSPDLSSYSYLTGADSSGNIYVSGYVVTAAGQTSVYLAKYAH